ncbi:ABC transporter permease [Paenibacillus chitinolyticus]|uniref:ABC transporter permease n=1 Tax=Paenibacillus chitinolyticus TaxID=79263 RepID=UPI003CFBEAC0
MIKMQQFWYDFSSMFYRNYIYAVKKPLYILFNLSTPLIWLLLFGQILAPISSIPDFGQSGADYLLFFAPGVVVMTTLYASGWSGMALLEDIQSGVIEKIISTPSSRSAVILGNLSYSAAMSVVQALVIVLISVVIGASGNLTVVSVLAIILFGYLISVAISSFSYILALLTRKTVSFVTVLNLTLLPLIMLSSAMMPIRLLPKWIQFIAAVNPMEWYVRVVRQVWLTGSGIAELYVPMGLIALLAVGGVLLCAYMFNRTLNNDWR